MKSWLAQGSSVRRVTLLPETTFLHINGALVKFTLLVCHSVLIMELCDECNNCTKFQFYTEKAFRDIPFFVISHHFVSTL